MHSDHWKPTPRLVCFCQTDHTLVWHYSTGTDITPSTQPVLAECVCACVYPCLYSPNPSSHGLCILCCVALPDFALMKVDDLVNYVRQVSWDQHSLPQSQRCKGISPLRTPLLTVTLSPVHWASACWCCYHAIKGSVWRLSCFAKEQANLTLLDFGRKFVKTLWLLEKFNSEVISTHLMAPCRELSQARGDRYCFPAFPSDASKETSFKVTDHMWSKSLWPAVKGLKKKIFEVYFLPFNVSALL